MLSLFLILVPIIGIPKLFIFCSAYTYEIKDNTLKKSAFIIITIIKSLFSYFTSSVKLLCNKVTKMQINERFMKNINLVFFTITSLTIGFCVVVVTYIMYYTIYCILYIVSYIVVRVLMLIMPIICTFILFVIISIICLLLSIGLHQLVFYYFGPKCKFILKRCENIAYLLSIIIAFLCHHKNKKSSFQDWYFGYWGKSENETFKLFITMLYDAHNSKDLGNFSRYGFLFTNITYTIKIFYYTISLILMFKFIFCFYIFLPSGYFDPVFADNTLNILTFFNMCKDHILKSFNYFCLHLEDIEFLCRSESSNTNFNTDFNIGTPGNNFNSGPNLPGGGNNNVNTINITSDQDNNRRGRQLTLQDLIDPSTTSSSNQNTQHLANLPSTANYSYTQSQINLPSIANYINTQPQTNLPSIANYQYTQPQINLPSIANYQYTQPQTNLPSIANYINTQSLANRLPILQPQSDLSPVIGPHINGSFVGRTSCNRQHIYITVNFNYNYSVSHKISMLEPFLSREPLSRCYIEMVFFGNFKESPAICVDGIGIHKSEGIRGVIIPNIIREGDKFVSPRPVVLEDGRLLFKSYGPKPISNPS